MYDLIKQAKLTAKCGWQVIDRDRDSETLKSIMERNPDRTARINELYMPQVTAAFENGFQRQQINLQHEDIKGRFVMHTIAGLVFREYGLGVIGSLELRKSIKSAECTHATVKNLGASALELMLVDSRLNANLGPTEQTRLSEIDRALQEVSQSSHIVSLQDEEFVAATHPAIASPGMVATANSLA
jgi:hypothetical protein